MIDTLADFKPVVVGVNVTLMVHEPEGATGATQPLAAVKAAASTPVTATADTTRLAVPVLVTVMTLIAEVVLVV